MSCCDSETDPKGNTQYFTYDKDSRITAVTDRNGNLISNPSGHNPPGLNRGDKVNKPANPDKPGQPSNPGTEDKADQKANKGEHIYKRHRDGSFVLL